MNKKDHRKSGGGHRHHCHDGHLRCDDDSEHAAVQPGPSAACAKKEIMYNKLSEMDKSARENYYGEIVDDTLYDYIAAGYVTGMGDKDARYYTAKQYLEYLNQQNGVVMGVGADVIKDANGYARIVKVYPNSPAEESGLQKNFYITKVGELDVKTLSSRR